MGNQYIRDFIQLIKRKSSSFSIGYRFYYWNYYSKITTLTAEEQMIDGRDNTHDHGGYTVRDMYVEAKYNSFSEEYKHYKHLDIEQCQSAIQKANIYLKSNTIKKMKARATSGHASRIYLHYGIAIGEPLNLQHLLALIFYTDFSDLCTAFSASFRALKPFESLKNIKRRNSAFHWMSKHLRELVELFGQCSKENNDENNENGPFYSGVSVELSVPEFAMRLNSPTSTTKEFAVSVKFGGGKGMVLTFDNKGIQFQYLRCINCEFISRYPEESERLFFGGFFRINLICLRLLAANKNMKQFVNCCAHLDAMLTVGWMFDIKKLNKKDVRLLGNLVKHAVSKKQSTIKFDEYIIESFDAYRHHKKEIILRLSYLRIADRTIRNTLMYPIKSRKTSERVSDGDFSNLFRTELLSLFPNAQSIVVRAEGNSMSMLNLLSLIRNSNLKKIVIKATKRKAKWMDVVWQAEKELLTKQYEESGFDILFKEEKIGRDVWQMFEIVKL